MNAARGRTGKPAVRRPRCYPRPYVLMFLDDEKIDTLMNNTSILIVDDMPANLKLFRLLLAHEGFIVRTAEQAGEALEALTSFTPDAVLTDIQLPGITGLELARRIRSNPQTKDMIIVGVSANAMPENIEAGLSAGCDGYITKPIDTRTFAASVRMFLERGRNPPPHIPEQPEEIGNWRSALAD